MWRVLLICLCVLGACTTGYNTGGVTQVPGQLGEDPERAEQLFFQVVRDMQPVAQSECRKKRRDNFCEFVILVDVDPRSPPNAYQTLSDDGQPMLTMTASMIASFQTADEMAFVMAHEVAHHILRHLEQQQDTVAASAELYARLAAQQGGSPRDIRRAQRLGAQVGAQAYSQDYEFEADRLGTVMTARAGYDPVLGSKYFLRLPEPDDTYLATHPPNEERRQMVAKTAAELGL